MTCTGEMVLTGSCLKSISVAANRLKSLWRGGALPVPRFPATRASDRVTLVIVWEAEHVHRRLREMGRTDPHSRRHGSWRHGYQLGPRPAASQVERFEHVYGIELPASYRAFLLEVGDGGAGPCFGMYRHDGSDWNYPRDLPHDHEPGFLAGTFPHTKQFRINADGGDSDDYDDPRFTCGSMVLAEYGSGAFYRLVVTGPTRGHVWLDDLGGSELLIPGPDFRDWYLDWLNDPPPLGPVSPRLIRLEPGRYSHAPAADSDHDRQQPTLGTPRRLRRGRRQR